MKRQLTWKTIFLFIVGATLLIVVAGLAVTMNFGSAKTVTRTATPYTQDKAVPSSVSLCTAPKDVTTLTVHRGKTMNPTTFSFPSAALVSNAASARSVAKVICAIPPDMRTGTIACPFDQGLTYRLDFTRPNYIITPIILHIGGCSAIDGTGKKGWIHLIPGLFRVLGNAMGLQLPTEETFRGKIT